MDSARPGRSKFGERVVFRTNATARAIGLYLGRFPAFFFGFLGVTILYEIAYWIPLAILRVLAGDQTLFFSQHPVAEAAWSVFAQVIPAVALGVLVACYVRFALAVLRGKNPPWTDIFNRQFFDLRIAGLSVLLLIPRYLIWLFGHRAFLDHYHAAHQTIWGMTWIYWLSSATEILLLPTVFAGVLIFDQNLGIREALAKSCRAVVRNLPLALVVFSYAWFLAYAGAFVFGFGMLLTVPLGYLVLAVVYDENLVTSV